MPFGGLFRTILKSPLNKAELPVTSKPTGSESAYVFAVEPAKALFKDFPMILSSTASKMMSLIVAAISVTNAKL